MNEQSWCVLRTGGPRTLPLFQSLKAAGYDAWTPVKQSERRRGRSRVRKEVPAPILPTFVFLRARHLSEIYGLELSPVSPHPDFSIFRENGATAIINDSALDPLGEAEGSAEYARRKRLKQWRSFKEGQPVTTPEGPFAGLSGVVERDSEGQYTLVCFGEFRVKIASLLLASDGVEGPQPAMGAAA